jgi:hypothetical protein
MERVDGIAAVSDHDRIGRPHRQHRSGTIAARRRGLAVRVRVPSIFMPLQQQIHGLKIRARLELQDAE